MSGFLATQFAVHKTMQISFSPASKCSRTGSCFLDVSKLLWALLMHYNGHDSQQVARHSRSATPGERFNCRLQSLKPMGGVILSHKFLLFFFYLMTLISRSHDTVGKVPPRIRSSPDWAPALSYAKMSWSRTLNPTFTPFQKPNNHGSQAGVLDLMYNNSAKGIIHCAIP